MLHKTCRCARLFHIFVVFPTQKRKIFWENVKQIKPKMLIKSRLSAKQFFTDRAGKEAHTKGSWNNYQKTPLLNHNHHDECLLSRSNSSTTDVNVVYFWKITPVSSLHKGKPVGPKNKTTNLALFQFLFLVLSPAPPEKSQQAASAEVPRQSS